MHLILKLWKFFRVNKLTSREVSLVLMIANNTKPTSNIYYEKLFHEINLEWKNVSIIFCIANIDTHSMNHSVNHLPNFQKRGVGGLALSQFLEGGGGGVGEK